MYLWVRWVSSHIIRVGTAVVGTQENQMKTAEVETLFPTPKSLPKCVDMEEVMQAVEEDLNDGFCLSCGESQDGCEPDARNYTCESCGAMMVFGASEILIMYGG